MSQHMSDAATIAPLQVLRSYACVCMLHALAPSLVAWHAELAAMLIPHREETDIQHAGMVAELQLGTRELLKLMINLQDHHVPSSA